VPQIEVSTFTSQIFWLIVTFGILYYLLSRKALPRVAEVLEARQDRIAADLDQAQRLRREAEQALEQYQAAMARAHDEAHQLLAETQARLQAEAAERHSELGGRLARQLSEAEARIAEARQTALRELEDATTSVVQVAVQRLAGIKVTKKAAQAALEESRRRAA
jgi:F-type H+-transporting ATPase subunit b